MLATSGPSVGADLVIATFMVVATVVGVWISGRAERRERAAVARTLDEERKARELRDQRLHDAVFGYEEGGRHMPGVVDVTVGNGHGSVLEVAQRAEQAAKNAANQTRRLQTLVNRHIESDDERWEQVCTSLSAICEPDGSPTATSGQVPTRRTPTSTTRKVTK